MVVSESILDHLSLVSTEHTTLGLVRKTVVFFGLKSHTSVHSSVKHFGRGFAFDVPTLSNTPPDYVHVSLTLCSFIRSVGIPLFQEISSISLRSG